MFEWFFLESMWWGREGVENWKVIIGIVVSIIMFALWAYQYAAWKYNLPIWKWLKNAKFNQGSDMSPGPGGP